MTERKAKSGELFHFLAGGVTFLERTYADAAGRGRLSRRGDEVTITDELIEANTDRNGSCWLDLLHDPARQAERYGRVLIAPGPFPEGELLTEPGTSEHAEAAAKAYSAARKIADATERKLALREAQAKYGLLGPTSRSTGYYKGAE